MPTRDISDNVTAPLSPDPGLVVQALTTENERLRQRVRQLENERDGFQRSLSTLLREHCARADASTDEDLDRLAAEALRLGSFEAELKQLVQGR